MGQLNPFTFKVIDRWRPVLVILFSGCFIFCSVLPFLWFFCAWVFSTLIQFDSFLSLCLDATSEFYSFTCFHNGGYFFISRYETPLRISCKASLAVTNFLHFCLFVKDFTPFSFLKCCSAGYSVLGSQVPHPHLKYFKYIIPFFPGL